MQALTVNATAMRICSHVPLNRAYWYVSEKPKEPADWGYSENPKDAIILTPWWQRRFAAYVRHCSTRDQVKFAAV